MSMGALSVPQKFFTSCVPSDANSRTLPMLDRTSITPRSGWRHLAPSQKKDSTKSKSAVLRLRVRSTSVVAIRSTVSASSTTSGSSPWIHTAFRNQTTLSQRGSSPCNSRSTTLSGTRTVWCSHGPRFRLYTRTLPVHTEGYSL